MSEVVAVAEDIDPSETEIEVLPPGVKRAKDGSLRTQDGKFVKGNKLQPPVHVGRPKRRSAQEIVDAIDKEFPPNQIVNMLNDAWAIAKKNQDAKEMMLVIQFIVHNTVGKPVQRTIAAQVTPEQFAQLFSPDSPQEDEGEVIDV